MDFFHIDVIIVCFLFMPIFLKYLILYVNTMRNAFIFTAKLVPKHIVNIEIGRCELCSCDYVKILPYQRVFCF